MANMSPQLFIIARDKAKAGKAINEALLDDVIANLAEYATSPSLAVISDEGGDKSDAAKAFDSLARFMASCHANGSYKTRKPERAFELGVLYGACELLIAIGTEEGQRSLEADRQGATVKYKDILAIVRDRPGINHGDLAAESGKSKSRLSQIIAEIKPYRLLTTSTLGKTKHYYLANDTLHMLDCALPEGRSANSGGRVGHKWQIEATLTLSHTHRISKTTMQGPGMRVQIRHRENIASKTQRVYENDRLEFERKQFASSYSQSIELLLNDEDMAAEASWSPFEKSLQLSASDNTPRFADSSACEYFYALTAKAVGSESNAEINR